MDDRQVSYMRDTLKQLDRPSLIALSLKIGVNRDDIEDVAYGVDPYTLPEPTYEAIFAWYSDHVLRKKLSETHVTDRIKDVSAIEGMTHNRVTAFIEERVELTESEKRDLLAFATGGYALTSAGKFLPPSKAPVPISAMNTSAPLPEDIARRGAALAIIKSLSTPDLEKLAKQVEVC